MNTQANGASETSLQSSGVGSSIAAALQPFYWSVRRELWENRAIYLAPLAAAVLFLVGSAIDMVRMRLHNGGPAALGLPIPHGSHEELAPALIMGVALIVSIFYCLDALYGERRDRSILFWKSLPVSDTTAVISKLAIPILVLPLVSFIITVATQLLTLVISSVIFAGSGASVAGLWNETSFIRVPAIWLYHLITVHGLWYAPFYAWLLLVSAWAPRAPFMWAALPPFVIVGVEKIAFNTTYFLNMLRYRLMGSGSSMSTEHQHDAAASLIPHHLFSNPGLWSGLAVAVVFLVATVQLRRSRGPI